MPKGSVQVAVREQTVTAWAGPLPPPADFERYERILAGAADRIMRLAEEEQRARFADEAAERRKQARGGVA